MKDKLDTLGAWALGLLWILPLAYAMWAAFHPPAYATRFDLFAPLTLDNFVRAWNAAPFPRYFLNTALDLPFRRTRRPRGIVLWEEVRGWASGLAVALRPGGRRAQSY